MSTKPRKKSERSPCSVGRIQSRVKGAPLSPCAVVFGDVSALDHEVGDEAVEGAALVSEPELTRAKRSENQSEISVG